MLNKKAKQYKEEVISIWIGNANFAKVEVTRKVRNLMKNNVVQNEEILADLVNVDDDILKLNRNYLLKGFENEYIFNTSINGDGEVVVQITGLFTRERPCKMPRQELTKEMSLLTA